MDHRANIFPQLFQDYVFGISLKLVDTSFDLGTFKIQTSPFKVVNMRIIMKKEVTITSLTGNQGKLSYGGKSNDVNLAQGASILLNGLLE